MQIGHPGREGGKIPFQWRGPLRAEHDVPRSLTTPKEPPLPRVPCSTSIIARDRVRERARICTSGPTKCGRRAFGKPVRMYLQATEPSQSDGNDIHYNRRCFRVVEPEAGYTAPTHAHNAPTSYSRRHFFFFPLRLTESPEAKPNRHLGPIAERPIKA